MDKEGLNVARATPISDGAFGSLGKTVRGFEYVPLDEMQKLERDYNIVKIGFESATRELKLLARKCKEAGR